MNILFAGLGSIGQRHLRNLLQAGVQELNIFAYRVRNASFVLDSKLNVIQGASLEKQYPITTLYSLEDAWARGIDAVFVCNPSSLHRDILEQAVEHDCHVFVEKPVSNCLDGLDELVRRSEEKQLVTFVGYQNRFHPCIEAAKHLLDTDAIGDVVAVNAEIGENVKQWHKYEDYRTMYACRKDLGGGVVLSQIHELDYIPYLLSANPHTVYAVGGKLSNLEIDVEDVASILLTVPLGGREIPVHIHEDYLQSPPSRGCTIIGTAGKLTFNLLQSVLTVYDADGGKVMEKAYEFERNDMFRKEMRLFLEALEMGGSSPIPLREGIKSLKIADAVKQSMETHSVIAM